MIPPLTYLIPVAIAGFCAGWFAAWCAGAFLEVVR